MKVKSTICQVNCSHICWIINERELHCGAGKVTGLWGVGLVIEDLGLVNIIDGPHTVYGLHSGRGLVEHVKFTNDVVARETEYTQFPSFTIGMLALREVYNSV